MNCLRSQWYAQMKRALDLSGKSPATLRLCYAGINFYFRTVLDRKWKLFSILHAEDQRPLPADCVSAKRSL